MFCPKKTQNSSEIQGLLRRKTMWEWSRKKTNLLHNEEGQRDKKVKVENYSRGALSW